MQFVLLVHPSNTKTKEEISIKPKNGEMSSFSVLMEIIIKSNI